MEDAHPLNHLHCGICNIIRNRTKTHIDIEMNIKQSRSPARLCCVAFVHPTSYAYALSLRFTTIPAINSAARAITAV